MILSVIFTASAVFASPSVKSLDGAKTKRLDKLLSPPAVAMIFQVDCLACQKQVQDLKCLEEEYRIVLMGAFSTEKSLRKESLKMKSSYPAYYASRDILQALNVSKTVTPQIVFFSKDRKNILLGYQKCKDLKSILSRATEEG